MSRVFIFTQIDDAHGLCVEQALQGWGHDVVRWFAADMPTRQTFTWDADDADSNWVIKSDLEAIGPGFDVIWYRRPKPPNLGPAIENGILHEEDIAFTRHQNQQFFHAFRQVLEPDAFWVNPLDAQSRASSKMLQLNHAQDLNLHIPPTRISNDPARIADFIRSAPDGGAIYKPLYTLHWDFEDGSRAYLPTTQVRLDDLPDNELLQLTPGIFQHRMDKAFEVRATFFGHTCVAVKINSQAQEKTKLDWRFYESGGLSFDAHELPAAVYDKCLKLMQKLGIVFGCFDFIVQPDGTYVFLEVNEMGQFLWLETEVPDLPMLDIFCQFLLSGAPDFRYEPKGTIVRLKDVEASEALSVQIEEDRKLHVA